MNPITKTTTYDPLVASAKMHFDSASSHIRKGCAEAIITGMHLIALHNRTAGNGHGGNRKGFQVNHVTDLKKGFAGACVEIGIPECTARRWMNAATNAALRCGLIHEAEQICEEIPEYGMPRWEHWEVEFRKLADGMSLSRLMVGQEKSSTEDQRYEELLTASEEGRERAVQLLRDVAEGKYTLVQAARALGSLEAYDKLRAEGGEKVRTDPVYIAIDDKGKVGGLVMKSLTTILNATKIYEGKWDDIPPQAKTAIRIAWLEVQSKLPEEIKSFKR